MSTRYDQYKTQIATGISADISGYEGDNVPNDFEMPTCTIEDVDRALFDLFDKQLPLVYKLKGQTRRVPVIFATGERFAILRRKRPLRDRAGALILPLVSIIRTDIEQDPSKGTSGGQNTPNIVKKKLSKEDPRYQALVNKLGLKNQDNIASPTHIVKTNDVGVDTGAKPGTVATRRGEYPKSVDAEQGRLLSPELSGKNIYEIIQLPPVKYFQANYEITFWAQYTQQMNDLLMAVMSSYQSFPGKTFRIESEKGYWFVAYFDSALTSGNNFDDFSDDERIVRYSFNVSVPGYIIAPEFPGALPSARKFLSAPDLSFTVAEVFADPMYPSPANVPSNDPGSYVLDDLSTVDDPYPGQAIGDSAYANTLADIGIYAIGAASHVPPPKITEVGGDQAGRTNVVIKRQITDPFTGEKKEVFARLRSRDQRKGETVYRESLQIDLEQLS